MLSRTWAAGVFLLVAGPAWGQPLQDADLPFAGSGAGARPAFVHSASFAGPAQGERSTTLGAAAVLEEADAGLVLRLLEGGEAEAKLLEWPLEARPARAGPDAAPYLWLRPRQPLERRAVTRTYYDTGADVLRRSGAALQASAAWVTSGGAAWVGSLGLAELAVTFEVPAPRDPRGVGVVATTGASRSGAADSARRALDAALRRGALPWSEGYALPVRQAWERLAAADRLPSTSTYARVLVLEPRATVRARQVLRVLEPLGSAELRAVYERGRRRLEALVALAAARASEAPSDAEALVELRARLEGLLDGTRIARAAGGGLAELGLDQEVGALRPGTPGPGVPTDLDDLAAREPVLVGRKLVAEVEGELLRAVGREVAGGAGALLLAVKGVGGAPDELAVWARELEAAGDAAQALWFREALAFYVPEAGAVEAPAFRDVLEVGAPRLPGAGGVAPPSRPWSAPAPRAWLREEVQADPGWTAACFRRIRELEASPAGDARVERALAGVRFVLDHLRDALAAQVAGRAGAVLAALEAAGGAPGARWVPSRASASALALAAVGEASVDAPVLGLLAGHHSRAQALVVARASSLERQVTAGADDWYRIDLRPGESVTFTISISPGSGDLDLEVRDGKGTQVGTSQGTGRTERVSHRSLEGGPVFLRVYGHRADGGSYTLAVE